MNEEKGKTTLLIVLILVALGVILFFANRGIDSDDEIPIIDSEPTAMENEFDYGGDLSDVTEGEEVSGVLTEGLVSGHAKMRFQNGRFKLVATFANLPDPPEGFFYEGWLVGDETVSTGQVEKTEGGVYLNSFDSDRDLTSYTKYVLTIEPDDGDPAPAEHIVEGELSADN